MGYQRLAYGDADTTATMRHDARCAEVAILRRTPATAAAGAPRPTERDKVKREITVDEAAYRLAAALRLHLD